MKGGDCTNTPYTNPVNIYLAGRWTTRAKSIIDTIPQEKNPTGKNALCLNPTSLITLYENPPLTKYLPSF